MANFRIVEKWRDTINAEVTKLTERRVEIVQSDFPLTHREVQRLVMPDRALELLAELQTFGSASVQHSPYICFMLPQGLEGAPRSAKLHVRTDVRPAFCYTSHDHTSHYGTGGTVQPWAVGSRPNEKINADVSTLEPDRLAALIKWVNAAVKEHRLQVMTQQVVDAFTFPGCVNHHAEQHQVGQGTFEDRHGIDLEAIAAELVRTSPDHKMRLQLMLLDSLAADTALIPIRDNPVLGVRS